MRRWETGDWAPNMTWLAAGSIQLVLARQPIKDGSHKLGPWEGHATIDFRGNIIVLNLPDLGFNLEEAKQQLYDEWLILIAKIREDSRRLDADGDVEL